MTLTRTLRNEKGERGVIELTVKENEKGKEILSICGEVFEKGKRTPKRAGQCEDFIAVEFHAQGLEHFIAIWKKWHLNDLNAGTPQQEAAIIEMFGKESADNFNAECGYLKSIGLYEVEVEGKPYAYGNGWLYREVPKEEMDFAKNFMLNK